MTSRTATTRGAGAAGLTSVLIRLKLRLMINRAGSTKGGWFGLTLSMLAGGAFAVVGFLVALAAGATVSDPTRATVLVLAPNVLVVAWALLPLATFGSDETLDPGRLVLYPLRRAPLMRAMLVTSLVGAAPVAAVVTAVGVAVGFGGSNALPIALPACVLAVLLAVALSRTLVTTLAAALSSRRSRDAAVVIGSLLAVGVQGLRFVRFSTVSDSVLDQVVAVARWSPLGLLGRAVIEARQGDWLLAMVELAPAAALVPLLLGLWGRALERSLTVVTSGSTSVSRRRRDRDAGPRAKGHLALLPAWLPWVAPTPLGAVVARDLRYSWRDPRRKSALLIRTLLALGGPLWLLVQTTDPRPEVVLLAAAVGYLAVLGSFNQFGYDGGALWSDLAVGDRMRVLLLGKNISALIQVLPPVVVVAMVLAAASDGWAYVPVAIALTVATVAVGLGVADVVSVEVPFTIPETRNPFGAGVFGTGGGGQGFTIGLTLFAASLLQYLLMAPVAIATGAAVWFDPAWLVVVTPLALAYGYGVWRVALRMAVERGWWREPELLAAVDPAQSN